MTNIEWWDQLAQHSQGLVLRKINQETNEKKDLFLIQTRSAKNIQDLMHDISLAVVNNADLFDVPEWISRNKKGTAKSEK